MRRTVILLTVLAFGFAPAPLPKKAARGADDPRLQGEWEVSGRPGFSVRITGRRFEILRDGVVEQTRLLSLDATTHPRRMDFFFLHSGESWPGIYRLEGDVLTLSFGKPGKRRPARFDDPEDWNVVLERKRP